MSRKIKVRRYVRKKPEKKAEPGKRSTQVKAGFGIRAPFDLGGVEAGVDVKRETDTRRDRENPKQNANKIESDEVSPNSSSPRELRRQGKD